SCWGSIAADGGGGAAVVRDLFVAPFKSLIRINAQVRKELLQVRRRPGAFLSLILGPFLIMALFGLGFTGIARPLRTIVVIPPGVEMSTDQSVYQSIDGASVTIEDINHTEAWARNQLALQDVDGMVIAPAPIELQMRNGHTDET